MPANRPGYGMSGMGEDIFGETNRAQLEIKDPVNDFLLRKSLKEWFAHQDSDLKFTNKFMWDKVALSHAKFGTWAWGGASAAFAATVINPNFTKRQSYYVRKFNIVVGFCVGAQWAIRNQNEAALIYQLKMWDYQPYEVRRAMQTKDYRYMAMFDYQNPDRKLFDEKTGKAI